MNVYLNEITGIADAITTMYMSKRTHTRELEERIRRVCHCVLNENGFLEQSDYEKEVYVEMNKEFDEYMSKLVKWGTKHITMLRFVDFSCTVEGLHRAGQDDWDAHAMRFNNRIIRASTRLATFDGDEISDYYKGKILPMDSAIATDPSLFHVPDSIVVDGETYVRSTNGYIREDLKDNKDVKRGLYMECIPSKFIFKCNITEFAHVFKERNIDSGANPEVKELCERIVAQITAKIPYFTREMFEKIEQ